MPPKPTIPALVTSEHRHSFQIYLDGKELPALTSGKLLGAVTSKLDLPVVGDNVAVSLHDDGNKAVIHEILPRSSLMLRKEAWTGKDAQPLAANISKVFIVMGLDENYNIARLERLLVAAWDSGAVPVALLTKKDLCPEPGLREKITAVERAAPGVEVVCLSSVSGEGVEVVEKHLSGGLLCCFIGSSGAGKSTLLNRLSGYEAAQTGSVRESDGRGMHITTSRQMYFLPGGGRVIDTPGIREFSLEYAQSGLDTSFSDIEKLAAACRFKDCSHASEPGCAVLAAVEDGTLPPARLKNYQKIKREMSRCEVKTDIKKQLLAKRKLKTFARMCRKITETKRKLRGN